MTRVSHKEKPRRSLIGVSSVCPTWKPIEKEVAVPTCSLPEDTTLDDLNGQAQLVFDLVGAGDDGAMSMVDEFHPSLSSSTGSSSGVEGFELSDAQLIIARMYRCESWQDLQDHLGVVGSISFTPITERSDTELDDLPFVALACLDYSERGPNAHQRLARAHELLRSEPLLASASIEAMAVVGDHQSLKNALDTNPGLIDQQCGPNGWTLLLYAAYSRIATDNAGWSLLETVKLLLERGADPNDGFLWRGLVPPFTALTGAFGNGEGHQTRSAHRLEIARVLLDAGADPNDGQTLYNNGIGGQNHDDPSHLELLTEFGLGVDQHGPWYALLGDKLREPGELLYDELEAAALRNRPRTLSFLLTLGLDLERPVGRYGKTAAQHAAENGHTEIQRLLVDAGVSVSLTPVEVFIGFVTSADDAGLAAHLADHPDLVERVRTEHAGVIRRVPATGAAVLRRLLDLGFDIDLVQGTSALHKAAQNGDVDLLTLLIEHGADADVRDGYDDINATPLDWANHFGKAEAAAYLAPFTSAT